MGQPITWIAPYKFNQRMPFDIDYKVMGTFLEFYMALVRFINYKLFSDLGLPYPVPEEEWPLLRHSHVSGQFFDCDKVRVMQESARKLFEGGEEDQLENVDEAF